MNSLIQQFSYLNPSRHFPRSSNMKSFQTASSLSQSSNTDDELDTQEDNATIDASSPIEKEDQTKSSVWTECDPNTGVCYRRKSANTSAGNLPKNGSDTQMSELQESCGNSPIRLAGSPPSGTGVASFPGFSASSFQFFPATFIAPKSVQSSPPSFGSSKEY